METYSFLRQLADSWFLLAMTWASSGSASGPSGPAARSAHQDVANSIFRNDDRPADATPGKPRRRRKAMCAKPLKKEPRQVETTGHSWDGIEE